MHKKLHALYEITLILLLQTLIFMCQQWKKYFYLISGTAVIIEPAGRTHDLNHSGSVEKKASTSQDINEGC